MALPVGTGVAHAVYHGCHSLYKPAAQEPVDTFERPVNPKLQAYVPEKLEAAKPAKVKNEGLRLSPFAAATLGIAAACIGSYVGAAAIASVFVMAAVIGAAAGLIGFLSDYLLHQRHSNKDAGANNASHC